MLDMMNNIIFQKNILNQNKNTLYSFYNTLNKYSHNVEENNDILSIKKKKNNDKQMIYDNFNLIFNNISNMTNKKDVKLNFKDISPTKYKNIKKKIINHHNHCLLFNSCLKKIKIFNINNLQVKKNPLKIKTFLHKIEKNKYINYKKYELNDFKKINILYLLKMRNQSYPKVISILKDNINIINNENNENNKKIFFSSDIKNISNILSLSKKVNKNHSMLNQENLTYNINGIELEKLFIQKIFIKSSNNLMTWKNLINHKMLLLIANQNSQAEIDLIPESLGSINILINMKDNAITLNFITQYNTVKMFLDDYMPFLRNALNKEGIQLEKYNIFSTLNNKKINHYKNFSNKYINNLDKYQKKINMYEKKNNLQKYKKIDCYV